MLRVPIEQAKEGMTLARSVANPKKPQHSLLKANFEIDEETIKRLRSLRVYSIWVQYPNLDFLDEILDPELTRKQQELYGALKEQFGSAQEMSLAKVDYSRYVQQVSQLFSRILTTQGKSSLFINEMQGEANDIFLHGTTVAYLALLTGMRLENYLVHQRPRLPIHLATDLTQLGAGCLLHDIGKLHFPEELKSFRLTAQDRGEPKWQKHTEAGFEMVQGGLDPGAAQVVLNHHQHFDGSGFPPCKEVPGLPDEVTPLEGKDIHIFCRIASIADRFENFQHLPDGSQVPTIVALTRLKNPGYAKWFDPVVMSAFMETVPPFAPGEQVILNNGQTVVVTELNEKSPCKPTVKPIDLSKAQNSKNTSGNKKESEKQEELPDIHLAVHNDLHIAKVGDFDVTKYLY
jgi:HD-GYP domain-containing protein (c-di-GMP phosphodiesterase class II)